MKYLKEIEKILVNQHQINKSLLVAKNYSEPLTGKVFKLNFRDLIYLFFELEKECGIQINANKMVEYQFNSICGIIKALNPNDSSVW